jgi:uncharacterized protein YbaP (TraB family)
MKKIFSIVVLGLTVILSCNNASSKISDSLLWSISGNGLEKPSYLFGTHHLIPISFLDNIEGLEFAFESTEQTVGEIDLNEMNHLQLKLMSEALMPEDITYDSLLNAEDIALLDSALHEWVGLGLDHLVLVEGTRVVPTSITTTPSFTISPFTNSGTPMAAIMISA